MQATCLTKISIETAAKASNALAHALSSLCANYVKWDAVPEEWLEQYNMGELDAYTIYYSRADLQKPMPKHKIELRDELCEALDALMRDQAMFI